MAEFGIRTLLVTCFAVAAGCLVVLFSVEMAGEFAVGMFCFMLWVTGRS